MGGPYGVHGQGEEARRAGAGQARRGTEELQQERLCADRAGGRRRPVRPAWAPDRGGFARWSNTAACRGTGSARSGRGTGVGVAVGVACRGSRALAAAKRWGGREPRPVQADPVVAERFSRDSMRLGGILTAMVTPFDADGRLDEDAAVRLMRHLLESGSDGLVLAGSTGEGATLTDEEKVRLWELGVAESGGAPIIAGTGTFDTRHSVELSERAAEVGVDALLVVTPYYVRPNRRGIKAHYEAIASATELPIVAYNIPSRTATDMPNDRLAELGQIEHVVAVKQARYEDMAAIDGLDLLAGNDDILAKTMDLGGTGGILVASHLVGTEMRRIVDEPDRRHEIEDGLRDLYQALTVTTNPIPVKAALNMVGQDVGGLRLPLVAATEEEKAVIRAALERHQLLAAV